MLLSSISQSNYQNSLVHTSEKKRKEKKLAWATCCGFGGCHKSPALLENHDMMVERLCGIRKKKGYLVETVLCWLVKNFFFYIHSEEWAHY